MEEHWYRRSTVKISPRKHTWTGTFVNETGVQLCSWMAPNVHLSVKLPVQVCFLAEIFTVERLYRCPSTDKSARSSLFPSWIFLQLNAYTLSERKTHVQVYSLEEIFQRWTPFFHQKRAFKCDFADISSRMNTYISCPFKSVSSQWQFFHTWTPV